MSDEYIKEIDPETGEIIEKKKKAMEKTWGVRLDNETTEKLEQIAMEEDLDKRELLKYFIELRKTSTLKTKVRGKADIIEGIEDKLSAIRRQMNELLEQNVEAEEIIRGTVADEMKELNDKIKSLQDKLNDQLASNKELKEEAKTLKATVQDKEKHIAQLTEDHASTKELNAEYKEKLANFKELKEQCKALETTNADLQAIIKEQREESATKDKVVAELQKELNAVQNTLNNKDVELAVKVDEIAKMKTSNEKEIANINAAHRKEIASNEELFNAKLQAKETEVKSQLQEQIMSCMTTANELNGKLASVQKEKEELAHKLNECTKELQELKAEKKS